MQIILTQAEIEEAIQQKVLSQIAIREDQQIGISFEDDAAGELSAVLVIGEIPAKKNEAPKSTVVKRTRGPNKPKVAVQPTDTEQTADDGSKDTDETKGDAPWSEDQMESDAVEEEKEVDGPIAVTKPFEEAVAEKETAAAAAAATEPEKPSNSIFPNSGTSAAPSNPRPAEPPALGGKSLFANLAKPISNNGATH